MRRITSDSKEARTIVVTGGADGIGRAVVLLCAARGDQIAVLDKNAEAAKTTADEAVKRGAKSALGLVCDVGFEEQVEKAFEIIWNKLGAPYGLFTSAAIDLGGLIHELPAATWHQVLDTNLNGTFLACKHAIRRMRQADVPGSIVCASSPTGFVALAAGGDRKSTRLNSSHGYISYAVFCLKKKNTITFTVFPEIVRSIGNSFINTMKNINHTRSSISDDIRNILCSSANMRRAIPLILRLLMN